jgi:uncharacterized Zn finger protein
MAYESDFPWRFGHTKKVEGGIKARAAHFGENWWSARWLELLTDASPNRLARGRSYARKGQITEFAVAAGKISGCVQGSADKPYGVEIVWPVIPLDAAERILRSMQRSPLFAARLLNQELPPEALKLFEEQGESLFPASRNDLETECSCPDEAPLCKHLAALFYLFSLQFERDPLLLLELRGIDRQRLMSEVRTAQLFAPFPHEAKREPLPTDTAGFWKGTRIPPSTLRSEPPRENATLVKQFGSFPFWRGENDLIKILEAIYAAATARAREILSEERAGG